MVIALLAGGTGGAKLACGLRDRVGHDLTVIANTADDIEIYDVHVSPDPDLITYRLAGVLDQRGFGIAGEGDSEIAALRARGVDTWFALGDDDFAVCRARAELLAEGRPLTAAHALATVGYDTGGATVLPMCDEPVRTKVRTPAGWRDVQQYLIADRCEPAIEAVHFAGIDRAEPTESVLDAIARADLIVIGPSNPVISISPILGLVGMTDALTQARAPVVAVSPFVGGEVLKGPTTKFMRAAGLRDGVFGFADHYAAIADVLVADEVCDGHAIEIADVAMHDAAGERAVADAAIAAGRAAVVAK